MRRLIVAGACATVLGLAGCASSSAATPTSSKPASSSVTTAAPVTTTANVDDQTYSSDLRAQDGTAVAMLSDTALTAIGRGFCSMLASNQGNVGAAQIGFNDLILPAQTGSSTFVQTAVVGRASPTSSPRFDLQVDATAVYCPAYAAAMTHWLAVTYPAQAPAAPNGS